MKKLIFLSAAIFLLFISPPSLSAAEEEEESSAVEEILELVKERYLYPEKIADLSRAKLPNDEEEALDEIFKDLKHSSYRKIYRKNALPARPRSCQEEAAAVNEAAATFMESSYVQFRFFFGEKEKKVRLGYLKIRSFFRCSGEYAKTIVRKITKVGVDGLILDLRGNMGGYVGEAAKTAGLFLPKGAVVAVLKSKDGKTETSYWSENESPLKISLIVIINEGTTSAGEIVALALKRHRAALLVGTKTFGKNIYQDMFSIKDYVLTISAGIAYGPDGKTFADGVAPDVVVLPKKDGDIQLFKALEMLTTKALAKVP